jgi:glutamate/aspartate transport system substrate-binding protein
LIDTASPPDRATQRITGPIDPIGLLDLIQPGDIMKKTLILAAALLAVGAVQAQSDTLKKIKDSGSITLGVRESSGALAYTLGDGKYVGFHTEMAYRVAADLQKQLGLAKLDVKVQPVTSQNRIPLVQNGTVDLECGSTTNNAARQKDVSFAMTTYVEEVRIAVKASSGITNIDQLNGKSVATTTGTTSVQTLRKHERAAGVDFKEVFGKDHADSFLLLESGRADAFVMDGQILAGNISKSKNPADYKIVGEVLSVEPIACMLRKDDVAFKKAVDDSIKAQIKSGELAKLYDKWFMQPIPPTNTKVGLPMSEATKAAWANPNDKPMEDYAKK